MTDWHAILLTGHYLKGFIVQFLEQYNLSSSGKKLSQLLKIIHGVIDVALFIYSYKKRNATMT